MTLCMSVSINSNTRKRQSILSLGGGCMMVFKDIIYDSDIHHTSHIIHYTLYVTHRTLYIIHHTSYVIHHSSFKCSK